MEDTRKNE